MTSNVQRVGISATEGVRSLSRLLGSVIGSVFVLLVAFGFCLIASSGAFSLRILMAWMVTVALPLAIAVVCIWRFQAARRKPTSELAFCTFRIAYGRALVWAGATSLLFGLLLSLVLIFVFGGGTAVELVIVFLLASGLMLIGGAIVVALLSWIAVTWQNRLVTRRTKT